MSVPADHGPGRERGADGDREVPLEDERSADDHDEGWGERPSSGYDDDWYLSQRPPHWD